MDRVAPPLVAFAASTASVALVAVVAGQDPWAAATWGRWDSGHYLAIAATGYKLFHCPPGFAYPVTEWCGNVGWFPGYPWLLRGLARLGLALDAAGVLASGLFHATALIALWNGFLGTGRTAHARSCLALAAVFPGSIYYHAIFPVSAAVLLLVVALHCLAHRRGVAAGVAGLGAAFAYTTGFAFAAVPALRALVPGEPLGERVRRALAPCALTLLGLGCVLLVHHLTVGAWNAFVLVQRHYGHGIHSPLSTLAGRVRDLLPLRPESVPALQTLSVAALVLALVALAWRDRGRTEDDVVVALYAVVFWSLPLVVGANVSLYRSEALLFPVAILARRLPTFARVAVVAFFSALSLAMAYLFFRATLV